MSTQIVIASHNPVKIRACQLGFALLFPDQNWEMVPVDVPSGVADQPMSDHETLTGAHNRAHNAQVARPGLTYYVGIEGGVEWRGAELFAFAWVVAISADGREGQARTAAFQLPLRVAQLVSEGHELGAADDRVFGVINSKQEGGAIGLLTGQAIDRVGLYTPAVAMALVKFKNSELYRINP